MYPHHRESIRNLVRYFRGQEGVLALILGGSVARDQAREDSDLDAMVVVTSQRLRELERGHRLAECVFDECTYPGGYFDVKYGDIAYLEAAADRGSEPTRHAFLGARCLFSLDGRIPALLERIPCFQREEKADKMLSFYSAVTWNAGYLWQSSAGAPYLRTRATADLVLFGLRLVLEDREILFPCHKDLLPAVRRLPDGEELAQAAERLLAEPDDQTKDAFVRKVLEAVVYDPPQDYAEVLTRFIRDNEQWWLLNRPPIAEW